MGNIFVGMKISGINYTTAKTVCMKYGAKYCNLVQIVWEGPDMIYYETMVPVANIDNVLKGLLVAKQSYQSLIINTAGKQYECLAGESSDGLTVYNTLPNR